MEWSDINGMSISYIGTDPTVFTMKRMQQAMLLGAPNMVWKFTNNK